MDGGDVELVAVEGGIVKVRLVGHCAGCPMSQMTLKNGIEAHLKSVVPEVLTLKRYVKSTHRTSIFLFIFSFYLLDRPKILAVCGGM